MNDRRNIATEVPLVYVVILNWNGWGLTLESLQTIEAMDYPNFRVLVIDNGSTDGSPAYLMAVHPTLALVETGENLGFTGGCNIGIAKALSQSADYVLLFNNDARAAPEMLSHMVARASEVGAAIVGARVMDELGIGILFNGRRWPAHLFGVESFFSRNSIKPWSHSDGADGCAMLVRRDLLEQRLGECGYIFDPGFFMYCEETDFCLYGLAKGYRCIISHNAIAYHGLAKSSGGGGNPRSHYYLTRNRIALANRWLNMYWRILFHLYFAPTRLLLLLFRIGRQRHDACRAILEGLRDGYRRRWGKWNRHVG